jgi:pimeloyl-ACP methyl ester carboxylesterase
MQQWSHRKVDLDDVRLHYVIAGSGDPVVLIHGFPQTWRCWRGVIPSLAERFTVIAPDYRGAGDSTRPVGGYDKRTMAGDLHALVKHLGCTQTAIVGHDIGMMVAYAYATSYPDETRRLAVLDAFLPGTATGDELLRHPRLWHVGFHSLRDVPEFLTAGREREYLGYFLRNYSCNLAAFPPDEIDEYARIYSAPGAMRAGFELYRALGQDAIDNRAVERKLEMPVLAIGGAGSTAGPLVERTMREVVAGEFETALIADSGHFIAEEAPQALTRRLLDFL